MGTANFNTWVGFDTNGQKKAGVEEKPLEKLMDRSSVVVPLLNHYKYGLLRRRLIQTFLGGPRIRKVPICIHVIQIGLLVVPLAFSIPFIVVDGLRAWKDQYLLALVYGIAVGVFDLVQDVVVAVIRWRHRAREVTEIDDEEDSVEIPSCLGVEAVDFVFSRKGAVSIAVHTLVSIGFSFVGFYVLLPSVMQDTLSTAGVVIVSLFGWFAICTAHYSLSVRAPPETAFYRPTDPLGLKFLYRPFYILLLGCIYIPLRFYVPPATSPFIYQILYVFLAMVPLAWILGVFSPLDAFVPWVMEQILTRLLGGSPLATDLRLGLFFLASAVSIGIVVGLNNITAFMLLAVFGFLLSQDLVTGFKLLLCLISSKGRNRISRFLKSCCREVYSKSYISYTGIGDIRQTSNTRSCLISLLLSFIKGALLLVIELICVYWTATLEDSDTRGVLILTFAVVLFAFEGTIFISNCLQKPYLVGLFRNRLFPFYTGGIEDYKSQRRRLYYASIPQKLLVPYVAPLIALVLIGLGLSTAPENPWQRIAAARLFRAVWQNTRGALRELTVVYILILSLPTDNAWIALGFPTNALIVGLLLQIGRDLFVKLRFVLISLLAFMSNGKLRTSRPLTVAIIVGSFALSPLVLGVVLLSSIFLTPLLPLFTLPVFAIAFPRPQRFWPSLIDFGSTYLKTSEETVYYQQAEAEMVRAVHSSMSCGAVSSQPGTQLLLRFDKRLALVSVLEAGYRYCTINIRGMELQETSCHSEEATNVDNMYEALHNPMSMRETLLYASPLSALTPLDSVVIHTHSDARNVLTGIIDKPGALQQFPSNLIKILVWIFNRHIKSAVLEGTLGSGGTLGSQTSQETTVTAATGNGGAEKTERDSIDEILDMEVTPPQPKQKHHQQQQQKHPQQQYQHHQQRLSIASWKEDRSKSFFSTILGGEESPTSHTLSHSPSPLPPLRHPVEKDKWLEMCPEGGEDEASGEREATTAAAAAATGKKGHQRKQEQQQDSTLPQQVDSVLPPLRSSNQQRSSISTTTNNNKVVPEDGPRTWAHPPLTHTQTFKLMQYFPHEWHAYLNEGKAMEGEPFELLSKIVVGCFSILVDMPAHGALSHFAIPTITPLDIHQRFCGNLPYSSSKRTWLTQHPMLWKLALKAYRYAVKLMYDEGCLGEVESKEEMLEYLEDYDKHWCIALESEEAWSKAILDNMPHLFSLGHDSQKNIYTAHVLSLQDEVVHIGTLNSAALNGIWADLALELFYLTNDDEERYSIQAHPNLLRNLSIQAAEPPLGYSVFSSGLVTLPRT